MNGREVELSSGDDEYEEDVELQSSCADEAEDAANGLVDEDMNEEDGFVVNDEDVEEEYTESAATSLSSPYSMPTDEEKIAKRQQRIDKFQAKFSGKRLDELFLAH